MKRGLALVLCLALLGCLWGCDREEKIEEGCTKYGLVSISVDGIVMSAKEAQEASGIDDLYLKLYEDGSAKMRVGKEIIEMTYADGQLWRTDSPSDKVPYTQKGDVITLTDGAFVYTFEK